MLKKLFVLVLLSFAPSSVFADDDTARMVQMFDAASKSFDRHVADEAWDQVGYDLDHMDEQIKRIQKAAPTRDVSTMTKRLADARAKVAAHGTKTKADAARQKQAEAMEREHGEALRNVAFLEKGAWSAKLDAKVAALRELEAVDRACRESAFGDRPSCKLAAKRGTFAKDLLDKDLPGDIATAVKDIKRLEEALRTDGTVTADSVAFLQPKLAETWQARYAELASLAGTQVPAERFAPIVDAAAGLATAFAKAQKPSRLPKGFKPAPATVASDAKARFSTAKTIKVVMGTKWDVVVDNLKIPVERTAHAAALVREEGESFCRLVLFIATQRYENGKYAAARAGSYHPEYQIGACK